MIKYLLILSTICTSVAAVGVFFNPMALVILVPALVSLLLAAEADGKMKERNRFNVRVNELEKTVSSLASMMEQYEKKQIEFQNQVSAEISKMNSYT